MLIQVLFRCLWRIFFIGTSFKIDKEVRACLISHIFHWPIEPVSRFTSGGLMGRAAKDIGAVRMAMGSGLLIACDACFYI